MEGDIGHGDAFATAGEAEPVIEALTSVDLQGMIKRVPQLREDKAKKAAPTEGKEA